MPDHVHTTLRPYEGRTVGAIKQMVKGRSSRFVNQLLGRRGRLWLPERFDTLMRGPNHWLEKTDYIHENPVVDGLVERAEDYPWSSLVTIYSEGRMETFPRRA